MDDLVRIYKFRIVPNDGYFAVKHNVYIPNEDAHKLSVKYNYDEEDVVRDLYFTDERLEILKNDLINKIKNCKNLNDIFHISCYDTDCYDGIDDELLFKPNISELI